MSHWLTARAHLHVLRHGIPRGCHPQLDIIRELPKTPIEIIMDIGAHDGDSISRLLPWFPQARFWCCEPNPTALGRLLKRYPTDQVMPFNIAISDQPDAIWYLDGTDTMATMNQEAKGLCVEAVSLVDFAETHDLPRIDYLKIDTEGHDLSVLRSARPWLEVDRIKIIEVEAGISPENTHHVPYHDLIAELTSHRYRVFGIYEQIPEWPTKDVHLRRVNVLAISPSTIANNRT